MSRFCPFIGREVSDNVFVGGRGVGDDHSHLLPLLKVYSLQRLKRQLQPDPDVVGGSSSVTGAVSGIVNIRRVKLAPAECAAPLTVCVKSRESRVPLRSGVALHNDNGT